MCVRKLKFFSKKHPVEAVAALEYLKKYFEALKAGAPPMHIKAGFIHNEPNGIKAIDQSGHGRAYMQTRLYVYAFELDKKLHLLTIGSKKSQQNDIKVAVKMVKPLKEKEKENG